MRRLLLALFALAVAPMAAAQNSGTAQVNWQHSGVGVTQWRLYGGRTVPELEEFRRVTDPAARSFVIDRMPTGDWYFAVTAVVGGVESPRSVPMRCTVPVSGSMYCALPGAPTNFSVAPVRQTGASF
jgi:hypothetical protein